MASNLRPISDPLVTAATLGAMIAIADILVPRRPEGMSSLRYEIFAAIGEAGPKGTTLDILGFATGIKPAVLREHIRALRWKGLADFDRIALSASGREIFDARARAPLSDPFAPNPFACLPPHTETSAPAVEVPPSPPASAVGNPVMVEVAAPPVDRLAVIRQAAERVAARKPATARLPIGAAEPAKSTSGPPRGDWIAERRARLAGAIAFLETKCVLVTPVDRDATVRTYFMTGNQCRFTAEQVIGRAQLLGWEGA